MRKAILGIILLALSRCGAGAVPLAALGLRRPLPAPLLLSCGRLFGGGAAAGIPGRQLRPGQVLLPCGRLVPARRSLRSSWCARRWASSCRCCRPPTACSTSAASRITTRTKPTTPPFLAAPAMPWSRLRPAPSRPRWFRLLLRLRPPRNRVRRRARLPNFGAGILVFLRIGERLLPVRARVQGGLAPGARVAARAALIRRRQAERRRRQAERRRSRTSAMWPRSEYSSSA